MKVIFLFIIILCLGYNSYCNIGTVDTFNITSIEIYGYSTNCVVSTPRHMLITYFLLFERCDSSNQSKDICYVCDTLQNRKQLDDFLLLLNNLKTPSSLKRIFYRRLYDRVGWNPVIMARINYSNGKNKLLHIDTNKHFIRYDNTIYQFDKRIIELILSDNSQESIRNLKKRFQIE